MNRFTQSLVAVLAICAVPCALFGTEAHSEEPLPAPMPAKAEERAGNAAKRLETGRNRPVLEIFEDNVEDLTTMLHLRPNNTTAVEELKEVYSGKKSVKVTRMGISSQEPIWGIPISETPQPGEFRYMRVAWKQPNPKGGCSFTVHMMDGDNRIRGTFPWYRFAAGYCSLDHKSLTDKSPTEWQIVTVDLFKEVGKGELRSMALNVDLRDGQATGYFDHICLGRSIKDLDLHTAETTVFKKQALKEISEEDAKKCWNEVVQAESLPFDALRKLIASPKTAVPVLKNHMSQHGVTKKQFDRLLADLDHNDFKVREQAHQNIAATKGIPEVWLISALKSSSSLEVRRRLEHLLETKIESKDSRVRHIAVRLLEAIDTPESREALKNH